MVYWQCQALGMAVLRSCRLGFTDCAGNRWPMSWIPRSRVSLHKLFWPRVSQQSAGLSEWKGTLKGVCSSPAVSPTGDIIWHFLACFLKKNFFFLYSVGCLFLDFLTFIYLAVLGVSCRMWELVLWPVIEPMPPALGTWSLNHWTTREVPSLPPLIISEKRGFHSEEIYILLL